MSILNDIRNLGIDVRWESFRFGAGMGADGEEPLAYRTNVIKPVVGPFRGWSVHARSYPLGYKGRLSPGPLDIGLETTERYTLVVTVIFMPQADVTAAVSITPYGEPPDFASMSDASAAFLALCHGDDEAIRYLRFEPPEGKALLRGPLLRGVLERALRRHVTMIHHTGPPRQVGKQAVFRQMAFPSSR